MKHYGVDYVRDDGVTRRRVVPAADVRDALDTFEDELYPVAADVAQWAGYKVVAVVEVGYERTEQQQ